MYILTKGVSVGMEEQFMKGGFTVSKTHLTAEEYLDLHSEKWVEKGTFRPLDLTEQSDEFLKKLEDWVQKNQSGAKVKNELRRQLHRFTYQNSFKPDGASHVSVYGTYNLGTTVRGNQDIRKLAHRYKGQYHYIDALRHGFGKAMEERGFVPTEDNDYPTVAEAQLAIEEDSLSSKGPFDGGDEWVALNTIDAMLETTSKPMDYDPILLNLIVKGLNRRRDEYIGHVDAKFKMQPANYVEMMFKNGLRDTFRGLPFLAAGNSPLQKWQYDLTLLMFSHLSNYPFDAAGYTGEIQEMTVDEFIQENLVWLHDEARLKMSDWFHMGQTLIVIISRDQGSAFKIRYKDGYNWEIYGRKDRKWRIVTPMPAFAQAWLQLASADLVNVAPETEGRIGLQDPATNNRRFADFIAETERLERVIIPADFSKFDTTIPAWVMLAVSSMYGSLYEDKFVRDALVMSGVNMSQKNILIPMRKTTRHTSYDKHHIVHTQYIKGDRNYHIDESAKGIKFSNLRSKLKDRKQDFDYVSGWVYIHQTYLASGHILTNTMGSDCNHLVSRDIQPYLTKAYRILNGRSVMYEPKFKGTS